MFNLNKQTPHHRIPSSSPFFSAPPPLSLSAVLWGRPAPGYQRDRSHEFSAERDSLACDVQLGSRGGWTRRGQRSSCWGRKRKIGGGILDLTCRGSHFARDLEGKTSPISERLCSFLFFFLMALNSWQLSFSRLRTYRWCSSN